LLSTVLAIFLWYSAAVSLPTLAIQSLNFQASQFSFTLQAAKQPSPELCDIDDEL
jgi:hypothetical protein